MAGMSAANTVLGNGGSVFLLDKFTSDPLKGGAKKPELAKVLCEKQWRRCGVVAGQVQSGPVSGCTPWWSLSSPNPPWQGAFSGHDPHLCFDSDGRKDCRETMCDGVDCRESECLEKSANVLLSTYSQTFCG